MLDALLASTASLGKPSWRPMLRYVAELHARSIRPAEGSPFPHPWEEIGPGYCYGPAFGHWDIVHQMLDVLPLEPDHARRQLENNLANQQPDGFLPGSIWMRQEQMPWQQGKQTFRRWNLNVTHPPVWPVAVDDYVVQTGDTAFLARATTALLAQLAWFDAHRAATDTGQGYFYTDISAHTWESGVDEGIRFLHTTPAKIACVDATAHVFGMLDHACRWLPQVPGEGSARLEALRERRDALGRFIQTRLWNDTTGFFHDVWLVDHPDRMAFEGFWPLALGAATLTQARRVIDENLLAPERFFSAHPLATVGVTDRHFELRMWRGPAWNSMTFWAARGCLRYGRPDAAKRLLERALDASALWFDRTGTIWEFYHPHAGDPRECRRKPHTPFNAPCRDYLGHNPLIAMARMWERC